MKTFLLCILGIGALVFTGIQFIPVQKTNPAVEVAVKWDSDRTRELFYRSCADCHSHETRWPWYSHIAPASWLVASHVRDGRLDMNISMPDEVDSDEAAHQIRKGEMPPADYLLMHPDARLTESEKKELISGLEKTFP